MKKFILCLIVANAVLAAFLLVPRFMNRERPQVASSSPNERPRVSDAYHSAAVIQQAAFKGMLNDREFQELQSIIETNRTTSNLKVHLNRNGAVMALVTASVYNHLTESQKQRSKSIAQANLAFLESISDNSAAMSSLPSEARATGFDTEKLNCLAILEKAGVDEKTVPIALPYVSHPNAKISKAAKRIVANAGYRGK